MFSTILSAAPRIAAASTSGSTGAGVDVFGSAAGAAAALGAVTTAGAGGSAIATGVTALRPILRTIPGRSLMSVPSSFGEIRAPRLID
jgi:hypothetical protein